MMNGNVLAIDPGNTRIKWGAHDGTHWLRQAWLDTSRAAELEPMLRAALLNGTYEPGSIRRVWIPKASGGQRGLGIPNVVDRTVQQAVHQVLSPHYEPTNWGPLLDGQGTRGEDGLVIVVQPCGPTGAWARVPSPHQAAASPRVPGHQA